MVPQPMYVYYNGWSFLGGAESVIIPLREGDNSLLKAEEVRKYITDKTKVLILNSPHNPTGQVFEKENRIKIAGLAIKHNFLVISLFLGAIKTIGKLIKQPVCKGYPNNHPSYCLHVGFLKSAYFVHCFPSTKRLQFSIFPE